MHVRKKNIINNHDTAKEGRYVETTDSTKTQLKHRILQKGGLHIVGIKSYNDYDVDCLTNPYIYFSYHTCMCLLVLFILPPVIW
jgi:hypothetical protein